MIALAFVFFAERIWGAPSLYLDIKDERINESSGVAVSRLYPGSLYTHNDSGDSARVFRISPDKKVEEFQVIGANALDWEDIATVRQGGKDYVYVADIGDNKEKRKSVQIYRFEEPKHGQSKIRTFDKYDLSYPDEPHNAEGFFVNSSNGAMTIVTKNKDKSLIFSCPAIKGSGSSTLKLLGSISLNTGLGNFGSLVTAADMSSDGNHVVLRTYSAAIEFDVPKNGEWWTQNPTRIKMPLDPQGEAICYDDKATRLFTSSEGTDCPIHVLFLKK